MNGACAMKIRSKAKSEENGEETYGMFHLRNPHLDLMDEDVLYHLALSTTTHNFIEMFGDVKFVCMGGTSQRMETFAHYVMDFIGHKLPTGATLSDLSKNSHRYSMFKVGPVLSISHGMGVPSIGILLHEILKLLKYAEVKDPVLFRIGTCGGIGHEPGTVVISEDAVDGLGNPYYEVAILGKNVRRPAIFDKQLVEELKNCIDPQNSYKTVTGKTMCANDFYEGQGRLDGAFCDYSETDKMEYLNRLRNQGVANIEMESIVFAAMTHHAGVRAADVCVTFLNRLEGDQVTTSKDVMNEWQLRPQKLVATYIKRELQRKGLLNPKNS